MDQSWESTVSMGDCRPMVVSPHLSPQLNGTICGCRCGCGCGCAGDGDVSESERLSDIETAIDSSESEHGDSLPLTRCTLDNGINDNSSERPNAGVVSPHAVSRQFIFWLLEDSLQLGEALLDREQRAARLLLYNGNADRTNSPTREPYHMDSRSTGRGNLQMISPGPGIGGWSQMTERTPMEHGQQIYILTPLRLSPECQHARGLVVEHMLIPEEAYLQENIE